MTKWKPARNENKMWCWQGHVQTTINNMVNIW